MFALWTLTVSSDCPSELPAGCVAGAGQRLHSQDPAGATLRHRGGGVPAVRPQVQSVWPRKLWPVPVDGGQQPAAGPRHPPSKDKGWAAQPPAGRSLLLRLPSRGQQQHRPAICSPSCGAQPQRPHRDLWHKGKPERPQHGPVDWLPQTQSQLRPEPATEPPQQLHLCVTVAASRSLSPITPVNKNMLRHMSWAQRCGVPVFTKPDFSFLSLGKVLSDRPGWKRKGNERHAVICLPALDFLSG